MLASEGWHGEAFANAETFLERASNHGPGCVILDVQMPGMRGPELHDFLINKGELMPVIFLTGQGDVPTGVHAIKRGAVDFLLKPVDATVLLSAVRQALQRHARQLAQSERRREVEACLRQLSAREREVMEHVVRGRLNKQIAGDLGIAEKTVKVHRGRVMEKMNVASLAELVHLCDCCGIGSDDAEPALAPDDPPLRR